MNKKVSLIIVLCLSALALAACTPPAETDPNTITGIVWQWESVRVNPSGETTVVPNPEQYTIIFNEDGTFTGMADCNGIGGTYSQEGGFFLTLGPSTLVFCGEASLDQEYLALLAEVVAGGPDGAGGLALENGGGEKRMMFKNGGPAS